MRSSIVFNEQSHDKLSQWASLVYFKLAFLEFRSGAETLRQLLTFVPSCLLELQQQTSTSMRPMILYYYPYKTVEVNYLLLH